MWLWNCVQIKHEFSEKLLWKNTIFDSGSHFSTRPDPIVLNVSGWESSTRPDPTRLELRVGDFQPDPNCSLTRPDDSSTLHIEGVGGSEGSFGLFDDGEFRYNQKNSKKVNRNFFLEKVAAKRSKSIGGGPLIWVRTVYTFGKTMMLV